MNTLSILIYLAGVLGNVQGLLVTCVFIGSFFFLFYCAYWTVERGETPPYLKRILALLFGMGLLASLLPGTKTVYAIAASEMGEVVVKTPEAQEVLQALKEKILDQLSPEQVSKTRPNPFEE